MTTDNSTRNTVAERLQAVASDCNTTASGPTRTYCTDVYSGCASNVLAYTLPAYNYIAYCPLFFDNLPALTNTCHNQDQATTVLHEETHAPDVYAPGTLDNAYGYDAAMDLTTDAAVNNADTYALYANGMFSSFLRIQSNANKLFQLFTRIASWPCHGVAAFAFLTQRSLRPALFGVSGVA